MSNSWPIECQNFLVSTLRNKLLEIEPKTAGSISSENIVVNINNNLYLLRKCVQTNDYEVVITYATARNLFKRCGNGISSCDVCYNTSISGYYLVINTDFSCRDFSICDNCANKIVSAKDYDKKELLSIDYICKKNILLANENTKVITKEKLVKKYYFSYWIIEYKHSIAIYDKSNNKYNNLYYTLSKVYDSDLGKILFNHKKVFSSENLCWLCEEIVDKNGRCSCCNYIITTWLWSHVKHIKHITKNNDVFYFIGDLYVKLVVQNT